MRWLWWTALGLVLLLVLWVGAFAAVFELGPDRWRFSDRTGRRCVYPNPRDWIIRPDRLGVVLHPIWRPLINVWAARWGIPDPDIG